MRFKFLLLIYLGKLLAAVSRLFNLGAGSTWPGHLALENEPKILAWLISQLRDGVILIAGTNGKTTTSKMVKTILQVAGGRWQVGRVVHNEAGANLLNGLTSALIMATDWKGKIKAEWGIFEVDEATLPLALNEFTPKIVVLLNLFRDQLDRYGEIDLIAQKWHMSLINLPKESVVILNADDPQIAYLGRGLKTRVTYFGLNDPKITLKEKQHAMDTVYCPSCGQKLEFSRIYFSHLGEWRCPGCKTVRPKLDLVKWDWPLEGVYNRYNTLAAVLAAKILGVDDRQIRKSLENFLPAFGRGEEIEMGGKKIRLLLSKNPTGFNESIRTLNDFPGRKTALLALNDRIPDGRDVSWIWDVDFEEFSGVEGVIASGDRAYDMGLRIKYSIQNETLRLRSGRELKIKNDNVKLKTMKQFNNATIEDDLRKAIQLGLKKTNNGQTFYILPTYSAMLEVRKILSGRKIL